MPRTNLKRRDALPAGTILRDFTIQAVIGHGGFGIVYRAGHNELDLTVAIKEYLPVELAVREGATVQPRSGTDRKDFEDGLRRFRDEAQALIDFDSHPSIVSCREFFRAHGTAYLVMAYEEGQSLAELLATREAEGRPFTESELLAVMTPVLEGLARVHAAGVLHRDIKPSNILIRRSDGRPVLIDFGAAKQAAAKYSKSQAPYTEGYAALEQVADTGKLGPWTDMYGAGAVMWRMVAGGNRPWEPPHPVRVELRSHAVVDNTGDPMPPARDLGKGRFAPRLLEAIDRCLRLRGTERIQGSRELLEALRARVDRSSPAVSIEVSKPSIELADAGGKGGSSGSGATVPESRNARRWVGWMTLASAAVGLCLALAAWWSQGTGETVRDLGPEGVMDAPSGDETATSSRGQTSDPTGVDSVRREDPSGAEFEGGGDDRLGVRLERAQGGFEQPWVRDWDALGGGIEDPGFAAAAQAYIARYRKVPEAGVWVARAEGLMAKLGELETALGIRREVGESWTNSLGMEFMWIEAGRFLMGSPEHEEGREVDELQHEVQIREGFWMKKYEVTQGEWESVMGGNPSYHNECGPRCPVEQVSWFDAEDLVRRLNGRESGKGYRYRLPTEAEWEYAARSGTTGARYGELDEIAWYSGNSGSTLRPAGQKRATAWGLHDMLGNVFEWTADWYGKYPSSLVTGPQGPSTGSYRVIRGGGWYGYAGDVRSANRDGKSPGDRIGSVGFRLVRTK